VVLENILKGKSSQIKIKMADIEP